MNKEERKEYLRKWREKNKEKCKEYSKKEREVRKEIIKEKRKTPEARKKMLECIKKWKKENIEIYQFKQKEYKKKNRYKINARFRVTNAIRRGKMSRGIKCECCGIEEGKMEAHHEDYDKPYEVNWLCFICHKKKHGKLMDVKQ